MKFLIATLLVGGTLVSADVPIAQYDECIIISMDVTAAEPTFINPNPEATEVQLIVNCGQRVVTGGGNFTNQQSLKYIRVDRDQAEVLVQAADDLLGDGDVFIPDIGG